MVGVYKTGLGGYRDAAPLLRALLARHEIENVKLLWRLQTRNQKAESRKGTGESLRSLWIDLGGLATVSMDGESPSGFWFLVSGLPPPYASIAATVARVHGDDLAAAELAFDRWVSQRLLDQARRLPRRESLARRMVELIVRERDAELVRRGAKWYGLTSITGDVEDVAVLRRERLRLCRRAFVGSPFLLAPAIAVILLAEEEARAVQALVERRGDESLDVPLMRTLAASQIGA